MSEGDPPTGVDGDATWVDPGDGLLSFACPRCEANVTARFYGPCDNCRKNLRAAWSGDERDIEAVEYEPKMNVTPNAVATKD